METQTGIKVPLIRLLWEGFAKYGPYYNLDLPSNLGNIGELLDLGGQYYGAATSLYLFPVTPEEIKKPLLAIIRERAENKEEDRQSVEQELCMALFLELTDALATIHKGLDNERFNNWEEKQCALTILDALGTHDEQSYSIARRYLEDDDSDVQLAALLLLSSSKKAKDLEVIFSALPNLSSSTLVSRLHPLLYKFSEHGMDVLPVLDNLYDGMGSQDYPLIARFVLSTGREELFDHILGKDDTSLDEALTFELYRNAYDYQHFYSKALELAEKWTQGSDKTSPLTYLLPFITMLTESEDIRTKYASFGEWLPRGGALMGLAAVRTVEELKRIHKNEEDGDIQKLLHLVIQIKAAGDKPTGAIRSYLDIRISDYLVNKGYEEYTNLIQYAPHLPALTHLPSWECFRTLEADLPYKEKVKKLSENTELLFGIMEERNLFDLFAIPETLIQKALETAGLIAAGVDSEEVRNYFEERFLTESVYDEALSYLLAIKNSGEPRSFAARTKEKLHRYNGRGITSEEFLTIQHIFYQTGSMNDEYSSMISRMSSQYLIENPVQLLNYIRFQIGWDNVEHILDNFEIQAIPQTDISSLENLRRLFTNQYSRISDFTCRHILAPALMNSREFAKRFIHLIPPEELFESPYFHYALIGENVPESVVIGMLSSFNPKTEYNQLRFFISVLASDNDWEVRQNVCRYIAKAPRIELFEVVKDLLADDDSDVREAAHKAFSAVSPLDPIANKVYLLEREEDEVEETVSSLKEKRDETKIENPAQYKDRKVMIEIFDSSKFEQLEFKRALSPEEWYGLCLSMQIDFHDEETGSIIAHVGDEETEEIVNVLLEERKMILFIPSWV